MPTEIRAIRIDNGMAALISLRRPTEEQLSKYAEWARPIMHFADPGRPEISLPGIMIADMDGSANACYPSGSAYLWIIDAARESALISLSAEREAKRIADLASRQAAPPGYKPPSSHPEYCPNCQSICYGDCTAN